MVVSIQPRWATVSPYFTCTPFMFVHSVHMFVAHITQGLFYNNLELTVLSSHCGSRIIEHIHVPRKRQVAVFLFFAMFIVVS